MDFCRWIIRSVNGRAHERKTGCAVFNGALSIKNPEAGLAEHKEFLKNLCEVAPSLNVVSDEIFTGYFERSNLPWYLTIVDRFAPTPQGDHRDWIKIQKWSKSLVTKFHPAM